jgi:2-desacetyl-2-hydroxyethyl bacteriochlorophyllide A dehydrogenase
MATVVQFTSPGEVELVDCPAPELASGMMRVRTFYSGISAGTELTAYRGSNPYVTKHWDVGQRLFVDGEPSFSYPVAGWGYSEVGQVVELGPDTAGVAVGDVVHGIWGHRSEAVLPAARLAAQRLPQGVPALSGVFFRVGAIALNAVLAADVQLGDRVVVFGQGVIGLLATRLAVLSGARVAAVDALPRRRQLAAAMGAERTWDVAPDGGVGAQVRSWTGGSGADTAIELSGNDRALHEAIRSVVADGTVVASGFYQGGAEHLRLGEEFHHNRVRIVASQIGGTPVRLGDRWDHARLLAVFGEQLQRGAVDPTPLVTDVLDAADVATGFAKLDAGDPDVLQVVLRFAEPGSVR